MLKLIKYEFRKTLFSKMILLVITALIEIAFFVGIFMKWERGLAIGTFGLIMCGLIGIFYIGIESLVVFQRDLNTKQSYMLFLTPRNSYQILGAKVLENGISIFVTGVFFAVLAVVDVSAALLYIGGLEELLAFVKDMAASINFNLDIPVQEILLVFFAILAVWLMMVVTGYFAIVLSATVLAGKKFSGTVSFVLYLLLSWGTSSILDRLPEAGSVYLEYSLSIAVSFVMIAIMYVMSCWIMERKLSV